MGFFSDAINVLKVIVCGIGAVVALVGAINYAEGAQNDNPATKTTGWKGLMSGAGIALIGMTLVPKLVEFFNV